MHRFRSDLPTALVVVLLLLLGACGGSSGTTVVEPPEPALPTLILHAPAIDVAVALSIFSGKTPEEISGLNEQDTFTAIGLSEHLTPQRSNGLKSLVGRIKATAEAAQAA